MVRRALFLSILAVATPVAAQHDQQSSYAGFETREINSLSNDDLEELRRGGGRGLALSAELNGVPGPAHVLELSEELGLDTKQVTAIRAIFENMQAEARTAGEQLIAAERAIEPAFREGGLDNDTLRAVIKEAERARAELRFIHLSRHLETPTLLTESQIAEYAELRGYGTDPLHTYFGRT